MAGNGSKHGDSITEQIGDKYESLHDKLDERVQRAGFRQELASAEWENEPSKVIQMEVDRRMAERRPASESPKSTNVFSRGVRGFQGLTTGWPWYGQLVLALAMLGAIVVVVVSHPNVTKFATWVAGLWP
jgi:hypothetical protein